jgi:hypothetical protein
MAGPSGGCLGDTNKEKTNSNHIPYHLKPILTRNRIEESTFFFDSPDNQAALPSNKWLRVSKQPWPLGRSRRFAVPRKAYAVSERAKEPSSSFLFPQLEKEEAPSLIKIKRERKARLRLPK